MPPRRELQRIKDEEAARFGPGTFLAKRYLVQKLLGRGGSSAVYQVG